VAITVADAHNHADATAIKAAEAAAGFAANDGGVVALPLTQIAWLCLPNFLHCRTIQGVIRTSGNIRINILNQPVFVPRNFTMCTDF
ncbi:MAG: hypothetical protein MK236_04910, partial [Pedosphaera sp.]|nr:hypothetical protein [Pedosphaera sp.]